MHLWLCPESLWTQYLVNHLGEFHQIFNIIHLETKIRFWGQKVKGQGHDETKYCQNLPLQPFSHHRTVNDDSLNWIACVVGDSAILGKMSSKRRDQTKCAQKQRRHTQYAPSIPHRILSSYCVCVEDTDTLLLVGCSILSFLLFFFLFYFLTKLHTCFSSLETSAVKLELTLRHCAEWSQFVVTSFLPCGM